MVTTVLMPIQAFNPAQDSATADENDKIKHLRMANPDYDTYAPMWKFFLAAYEGGASFTVPENIFKHQRENQEDYNDRVKRIHNMNYCEPLVDFFTNFIFSESIDRNGGSQEDFYKKFASDVNLRGDSIDDFMRQVCDDMQIFGMTYVLVDAPITDGAQLSKYDEQDNDIRPYWVLIKPSEITDWVVDDFGEFEYAKRKQVKIIIDSSARKKIEIYTEFYKDRYEVSKVDVTNPSKPIFIGTEYLPNALGEIPLVIARYKHSKELPYIGLSFLRDFAYNNREIINLTSLLQEFLYRQAFNILAREVESGLPENEQVEGDVGTANAIAVPKGAEFPRYITPPAEPAKFIQEERGRIKNEMFARAAQDAVNELFNGEKSSGFSQAQSFSKTAPFIASRADTLEKTENALMDLTMRMSSQEWDGKIKYKDNYAITNLTDAITQFLMLVKDLQLGSETFVKCELKRMVHEFDGKLEENLLTKIEREIDEMPFSPWAETQKEALIGVAPTSPAGQQKPKNTGTMAEAAAEAKTSNTGATKKVRT